MLESEEWRCNSSACSEAAHEPAGKQVSVLYETEVNKQQVSQQTVRSSSHSPSGWLGMARSQRRSAHTPRDSQIIVMSVRGIR